MIRATWTMRLGFLSVVVSIATLGTAAAIVGQSSAAPAVTGVHANEEFCKTMIRQFELFTQFAKIDPLDMTKRAKYFADQKALNATLVKTAPASLAIDVALQTKNANTMIDAQAARHAGNIKASAGVLRSPQHLAASRHMADYCGIKATVSR